MKICFSGLTKQETGQLSSRFGRCPFFLIYDEEKEEWQALENTAVSAMRGAGIAAAQMVIEENCQAVISGNMGPRAYYGLKSGNIKIYLGQPEKSIIQNLALFQDEQLQELEQANQGQRGG